MSGLSKTELRAKMPLVTAFIDDLRAVFGEAEINDCIRRGLHPNCRPDRTFYASEGGVVLGKRRVDPPTRPIDWPDWDAVSVPRFKR